ncbi:CheW protein [Shewanella sediminis HAW-EB3]|uniref:CheW protein n=1 Tax=Shewanella sediminis (strain HAW-EB3) TaxID=425104 RepID=A8FXS3_SHESH|nr:chemotaxis protein CheW [Shewanella sediminis]ABV37646.1 CheW protein [Shewanella sediminis HAW-EB3]
MTTSVDETVFDYFSLLLTEVEDESNIQVEALTADIAEQVFPELISDGSSVEALKPEALNQEQVKPDLVNKKAVNIDPLTQESSRPAGNESVTEKPEAIEPPRLQTQLKTQSHNQTHTETQALTKPKIRETDPNLDKLALEQLLAPVFKPEPQIETESIVKLQNQTLAKSKIKTTSVPDKVSVKPKVDVHVENKADIKQKQKQEQELELKTQLGEIPPKVTKDLLETLDDEFQVLFFKVAGLTLAVPLVSLGGIVKIERINHIMGRPAWYKGVQTYRDTQLNVVDTGAWVMPEKYDKALAESVNYQYVVLLEDSNWGLTCESLVNAVRITKSEVNWRSKAGKRPWLAGVVKEQMCGILHVQALIELLNSGLGSQDPVG